MAVPSVAHSRVALRVIATGWVICGDVYSLQFLSFIREFVGSLLFVRLSLVFIINCARHAHSRGRRGGCGAKADGNASSEDMGNKRFSRPRCPSSRCLQV